MFVVSDPINYNDPQGLKCVSTSVAGKTSWADDGAGGGCDKAGVAGNGSMTSHTIYVEGYFTGFGGQTMSNQASLEAQPFDSTMFAYSTGPDNAERDARVRDCIANTERHAELRSQEFSEWLATRFTPTQQMAGGAQRGALIGGIRGYKGHMAPEGFPRGIGGAAAGAWVGAVIGLASAALISPLTSDFMRALGTAIGDALIRQVAAAAKTQCKEDSFGQLPAW